MTDDVSAGSTFHPAVLDLPPSQALRLGVEGTDPPAHAKRRARAEEIVDQARTAINQAYENAHWMNEFTVHAPHLAHVLAKNDGDRSEPCRTRDRGVPPRTPEIETGGRAGFR